MLHGVQQSVLTELINASLFRVESVPTVPMTVIKIPRFFGTIPSMATQIYVTTSIWSFRQTVRSI